MFYGIEIKLLRVAVLLQVSRLIVSLCFTSLREKCLSKIGKAN